MEATVFSITFWDRPIPPTRENPLIEKSVLELADLLGGKILGGSDLMVRGLRSLDQADPDCLSPLLRKRYLHKMSAIPGAVLTDESLAPAAIHEGVTSVLVHEDPVLALARVIDIFFPSNKPEGFVHPSAIVDDGATVHPSAWIGPGAVIEAGVEIGEASWIGPNAVIMEGTLIGKYVRIGPGAVIGYEGFGFVPGVDGPVKIRQVGRVELRDFVEIGAGACVDRGTLGPTVIGRETKIDNLVQVGHNVRIGERTLIAAQTGLAGSTLVGDDVMLGGQVGVADHVSIGDGVRVAGQGGVTGDVPRGSSVAGMPAIPHERWRRAMARFLASARIEDESNTEDQ